MLNFNFTPFPLLQTNRLVLRAISNLDLNEIFILRSHPEIMKYIAKSPAENLDEAVAFIDKINFSESNNQSVNWAITLKGDTKLVGNICLWNLQPKNHRAELGYSMLPGFHRKGIMYEAIGVVLKYAFEVLNIHSIEGHVNPLNEGSVKLLERNKFIREAYFKQNQNYNGQYFDTAVYTLFQDAWEKSIREI